MPSELGFTSLSVLILSIYCVTTRHWGNQSGCYSRHYDLLVFCMGKKKPPKQQLLWSVIKTVLGWDDGMGELDLVENQQVAPSVQPPLRCCKGLAAPTTFSAANTLRFRLWSPIQGTPSPLHFQIKVTPFLPQASQGHTLPQTGRPPLLSTSSSWAPYTVGWHCLACISAGFRPLPNSASAPSFAWVLTQVPLPDKHPEL